MTIISNNTLLLDRTLPTGKRERNQMRLTKCEWRFTFPPSSESHLMWRILYNIHIFMKCFLYLKDIYLAIFDLWNKDGKIKTVSSLNVTSMMKPWPGIKWMANEHLLIMWNVSASFSVVKKPKRVPQGAPRMSPLKIKQIWMSLCFNEWRNNRKIHVKETWLRTPTVKENCDHRFHSRLLSLRLYFRALNTCI